MDKDLVVQELDLGGEMSALSDNLDDLLMEDLNLEDQDVIEDLEPGEIEAVGADELLEADEAQLEASDIREEIYAAGEPSDIGELEVTEPEATEPAKPRKAREPGKTKAPAKPKIERSLAALPPELFVLDNAWSGDLAGNMADVLAKRPTQKKIAEKFDNFFPALHAGRSPSVYAMHVYRALKASSGGMTMKDMVGALETAKYTIGTARSQAGQIAFLFTLLRIVDKVGSVYRLRTDSPLAAKLDALLSVEA